MADEPTPGEIMRQIQSLVRQVESLIKEVRLDYVRKEVYEAKHAGLTRRVDQIEATATREIEQLEKEVDERESKRQQFQRQIIAGVIVGVILMVGQTALTLILAFGGAQ